MPRIDDLNNHPKDDGYIVTAVAYGTVLAARGYAPIMVPPRDLVIEGASIWFEGALGSSSENFTVSLQKVGATGTPESSATVMSDTLSVTEDNEGVIQDFTLDLAREDRTVLKGEKLYLGFVGAGYAAGTTDILTVTLFCRVPSP